MSKTRTKYPTAVQGVKHHLTSFSTPGPVHPNTPGGGAPASRQEHSRLWHGDAQLTAETHAEAHHGTCKWCDTPILLAHGEYYNNSYWVHQDSSRTCNGSSDDQYAQACVPDTHPDELYTTVTYAARVKLPENVRACIDAETSNPAIAKGLAEQWIEDNFVSYFTQDTSWADESDVPPAACTLEAAVLADDMALSDTSRTPAP